MASNGRAYLNTPELPFASPSAVFLAAIAGKRIVITGGHISVTEVSGIATSSIQLISTDLRLIFSVPHNLIGIFQLGPYKDGIKLNPGEGINIAFSNPGVCYAQLEYYLENTYQG